MKTALSAFAACATMILAATRADGSDVTICIGKFRKNCPVPTFEGYYGCGKTRDEVAAEVCTITSPNGTKETRSFSVVSVNSRKSADCDYDVFRVSCHDK